MPHQEHTPLHDDGWFRGQERPARIYQLSAWFAIIERGLIEPGWSTLGQRLEYVKELAGESDKKWAKAAGISGSVLSRYLSGERAREGDAIDSKTGRQILKLLRAAKIPVDLPWIMGGSNSWMSAVGYWGRVRWALSVMAADGRWQPLAKRLGLRRPEIDSGSGGSLAPEPPDADAYTLKIIGAVPDSMISAAWIRTGSPETPPGIIAVANELFPSAAQDSALAGIVNQPAIHGVEALRPLPENGVVTMEWTFRLLNPLLKLVQSRLNELPKGIGDEILRKLLVVYVDRLSMEPLLTGVAKADALDNAAIRNRRFEILKAVAARDAGPTLK